VECKLCGEQADFAHFGTCDCTKSRALANVQPSTFMLVAIQLLGWPECGLIMSLADASSRATQEPSGGSGLAKAWTSGLPTFDPTVLADASTSGLPTSAGSGVAEAFTSGLPTFDPTVGSGVFGHAGSRYSSEEIWQMLMCHGCCVQMDAQGFYISWNCHIGFEHFNRCEVPMVMAMCDYTAQRIQASGTDQQGQQHQYSSGSAIGGLCEVGIR